MLARVLSHARKTQRIDLGMSAQVLRLYEMAQEMARQSCAGYLRRQKPSQFLVLVLRKTWADRLKILGPPLYGHRGTGDVAEGAAMALFEGEDEDVDGRMLHWQDNEQVRTLAFRRD